MQNQLSPAYRKVIKASQNSKKNLREPRQSEKLTFMADLAASIAHEVNNPLAGVLMYTKLLRKKISNDNISKGVALDYLSKMDFELTRTTTLIRNLKDFGRQSSPVFRELNIINVVDQSLDLLGPLAELQRIQISRELDPSPPKILADSCQMRQVFANLFLNAIEAMPDGGKLTVRSLINQKWFKIEIQDTGLGISKKNIGRLFTPFFSTKPEVKGVGLGLAVSYGLVKRHGGSIEVKSQPGKGSTFTVLLPIIQKEARDRSQNLSLRLTEL
jgi:two-component system, NtrC family, sensor kinase